MIDWSNRPRRVFDLYVKLSAWLVPSFLLSAFVGLHLLSALAVSRSEHRIAARVAMLTREAAAGIESVTRDGARMHPVALRQVAQTLLADPAIKCASLSGPGGTIFAAPLGIGCGPVQPERRSSVPLSSGRVLEVGWTLAELEEVRAAEREMAMLVVMLGLAVALLTNWLTFRVIIGRPLDDLIGRIERARAEAEHSALHDSLTGLPNRRQLDVALDVALAEARREGALVAAMHLDLDGFKAVNDTMGHAAGDAVLTHVAKLLLRCVEPGDMVARVGGDEFVILLGRPSIEARASKIADAIIADLSEPFEVTGETARIGTSIGIAAVDPAAEWSVRLPERLLADADTALYEAKGLGRGKWVVCSEEMHARVERRRRLAEEIEAAIDRGEFVVHYQPQFDGLGERFMGVEALVRWNHPRRGLLMPAKFVEVAEELQLVDRIDGMVFARAVADLRAWDAAGLHVPRVSVNVSARRLNTPDLVDQVTALAPPPGRLVFEVLESVYLDRRRQHVSWNLDALAELGIEIEIDDFGTGHSSISSVLAIRPARLKVAREIIQAFVDDGGQSSLVEAVVALGRSLDVGLVAEGVETQAQLRAIREMGFDMIQGFALAEPMPAQHLAGFLERREGRAATAGAAQLS